MFQLSSQKFLVDSFPIFEEIILNPRFDEGLKNWSERGCKVELRAQGWTSIVPFSGRYFACTRNRKNEWNGIQQDITTRVYPNRAYQVDGVVRILSSNNVRGSEVCATVYLKTKKSREEYNTFAKFKVTTEKWTSFKGKFLINGDPASVVIFIEGPEAGIDILLDSLIINRVPNVPPTPPLFYENPTVFGRNIIDNSDLSKGTSGWFGLGNCTFRVENGSPGTLPTLARNSLAVEPRNSNTSRFLVTTNRTQTWMGPAQKITEKLEILSTYQVAAWVKVGSTARGPQNVVIKLKVTGKYRSGGEKPPKWITAGEIEAKNDGKWYELAGSFRIEKKPIEVLAYVEGPDPNVDLHVAGLWIFPVDRKARFGHLKKQTDKIRKRDVILNFSGFKSKINSVKVRQTRNSFPFGSCLYRSNLDNDRFIEFFSENFNWAVFANELKWHHMEQNQGKLNYNHADQMLEFCEKNGIQTRGHCIFWEVEGEDPKWVHRLSERDLRKAVDNRLKGLAKYKGKFSHYDVNNEMLHGEFYKGKLGKEMRAKMFNLAHEFDPNALLFTNEYHVDDGKHAKSSPEKYIHLIKELRSQGAKIGGIGIQGHNETPVGSIICSALDKLGGLGLPIWFTELEVSSRNDHVRADDLEVMIREAYAHPAVEGIMLWGFWELYMSNNKKGVSHLVHAEGELSEAGKRFVKLRNEFLTSELGRVDGNGRFKFNGFHGSYTAEIATASGTISKAFVVEKGNSPLDVTIKL